MLSDVNPLWIFAAVAAVILARKGHLRLPSISFGEPSAATLSAQQGTGAGIANTVPQMVSQTTSVAPLAELGKYDASTLGVAFARAKRAEAIHTVDCTLAEQAGAAMHSVFAGPFSTPLPAGPSSPAGAPPHLSAASNQN